MQYAAVDMQKYATYANEYGYTDSSKTDRHFKCSTCYCPSGTERCESCWKVSKGGRVMFWVGFGIMTAATIGFMVRGWGLKGPFKATLVITPMMSAAITIVSAVTYLVLATDHGYFAYCDHTRPFYYVRYIDWLITTPLILILLSSTGAIPSDATCFMVLIDIAMIFCGFVGSANTNGARWAFFAFGLIAMLSIFGVLAQSWNNWWKLIGAAHPGAKSYSAALTIMMVSWSLYAVMWILTDGSHAICRDVEAILYLGLDIVSKVIFLLVLNSWMSTGFNPIGGHPTPLVDTGSSLI